MHGFLQGARHQERTLPCRIRDNILESRVESQEIAIKSIHK
ncbi:hypothetical protein SM0020_03370 [Sinorhizobium meliloti CCNWSX0020]|uniref:Uncharacterized protein n=1 Tax=Sinorhizobium meliloti CCNWSX0020 TaxID=1107881 RepID=H0FU47_RHIML|nr:hypothetical protein SM0020_03370 [Sinorhizobium meliloti CCNWSX0020]